MEPTTEDVKKEVKELFSICHLVPTNDILELFATVMLRYYHQGANDALTEATSKLNLVH